MGAKRCWVSTCALLAFLFALLTVSAHGALATREEVEDDDSFVSLPTLSSSGLADKLVAYRKGDGFSSRDEESLPRATSNVGDHHAASTAPQDGDDDTMDETDIDDDPLLANRPTADATLSSTNGQGTDVEMLQVEEYNKAQTKDFGITFLIIMTVIGVSLVVATIGVKVHVRKKLSKALQEIQDEAKEVADSLKSTAEDLKTIIDGIRKIAEGHQAALSKGSPAPETPAPSASPPSDSDELPDDPKISEMLEKSLTDSGHFNNELFTAELTTLLQSLSADFEKSKGLVAKSLGWGLIPRGVFLGLGLGLKAIGTVAALAAANVLGMVMPILGVLLPMYQFVTSITTGYASIKKCDNFKAELAASKRLMMKDASYVLCRTIGNLYAFFSAANKQVKAESGVTNAKAYADYLDDVLKYLSERYNAIAACPAFSKEAKPASKGPIREMWQSAMRPIDPNVFPFQLKTPETTAAPPLEESLISTDQDPTPDMGEFLYRVAPLTVNAEAPNYADALWFEGDRVYEPITDLTFMYVHKKNMISLRNLLFDSLDTEQSFTSHGMFGLTTNLPLMKEQSLTRTRDTVYETRQFCASFPEGKRTREQNQVCKDIELQPHFYDTAINFRPANRESGLLLQYSRAPGAPIVQISTSACDQCVEVPMIISSLSLEKRTADAIVCPDPAKKIKVYFRKDYALWTLDTWPTPAVNAPPKPPKQPLAIGDSGESALPGLDLATDVTYRLPSEQLIVGASQGKHNMAALEKQFDFTYSAIDGDGNCFFNAIVFQNLWFAAQASPVEPTHAATKLKEWKDVWGAALGWMREVIADPKKNTVEKQRTHIKPLADALRTAFVEFLINNELHLEVMLRTLNYDTRQVHSQLLAAKKSQVWNLDIMDYAISFAIAFLGTPIIRISMARDGGFDIGAGFRVPTALSFDGADKVTTATMREHPERAITVVYTGNHYNTVIYNRFPNDAMTAFLAGIIQDDILSEASDRRSSYSDKIQEMLTSHSFIPLKAMPLHMALLSEYQRVVPATDATREIKIGMLNTEVWTDELVKVATRYHAITGMELWIAEPDGASASGHRFVHSLEGRKFDPKTMAMIIKEFDGKNFFPLVKDPFADRIASPTESPSASSPSSSSPSPTDDPFRPTEVVARPHLDKMMLDMGLQHQTIKGDGNCFFNAIGHQLLVTAWAKSDNNAPAVVGASNAKVWADALKFITPFLDKKKQLSDRDQDNLTALSAALRKSFAEYLRAQSKPLLDNIKLVQPSFTDEMLQPLIDKAAKDGEYSDQFFDWALDFAVPWLNRPICRYFFNRNSLLYSLVCSFGFPSTMAGAQDSSVANRARNNALIIFKEGDHYNSVTPLSPASGKPDYPPRQFLVVLRRAARDDERDAADAGKATYNENVMVILKHKATLVLGVTLTNCLEMEIRRLTKGEERVAAYHAAVAGKDNQPTLLEEAKKAANVRVFVLTPSPDGLGGVSIASSEAPVPSPDTIDFARDAVVVSDFAKSAVGYSALMAREDEASAKPVSSPSPSPPSKSLAPAPELAPLSPVSSSVARKTAWSSEFFKDFKAWRDPVKVDMTIPKGAKYDRKAKGTAFPPKWDQKRKMRGRPLVIAHRGDVQAHQENTIEAFTSALEKGYDGVEFDVVLDADGVPWLFHDQTIGQTCEVPSSVKGAAAVAAWQNQEIWAMHTSEVSQLRLKQVMPYNPRLRYPKPLNLTLFEHVLQKFQPKKGDPIEKILLLDIELKKKGSPTQIESLDDPDPQVIYFARKIIRLVKHYGMLDQVIISGFTFVALAAAKAEDPSITRGFGFDDNFPEKFKIDLGKNIGNANKYYKYGKKPEKCKSVLEGNSQRLLRFLNWFELGQYNDAVTLKVPTVSQKVVHYFHEKGTPVGIYTLFAQDPRWNKFYGGVDWRALTNGDYARILIALAEVDGTGVEWVETDNARVTMNVLDEWKRRKDLLPKGEVVTIIDDLIAKVVPAADQLAATIATAESVGLASGLSADKILTGMQEDELLTCTMQQDDDVITETKPLPPPS